jgi:2,3-diketo-5-methylthio-1-phosphopentane phosphatase
MPPDVVILSDFDGTIVTANVLESLYGRFGTPLCQQATGLWDRGLISTQEELATCFGTFTATRQEMESHLETFRVEPAMHKLVRLCSKKQWAFAIVSDGLRWYVDFILKRNGFSGIDVYANDIEFLEPGYRFSFPHSDPSTPKRGVSKSAVVRTFQRLGYRVIFIGDGLSDTDTLSVADSVYAMGDLLAFAQANGINSTGVRDLADAVDALSKVELGQL